MVIFSVFIEKVTVSALALSEPVERGHVLRRGVEARGEGPALRQWRGDLPVCPRGSRGRAQTESGTQHIIFSVFTGVLVPCGVFKGVVVLYSVFNWVLVLYNVFNGVLVIFSVQESDGAASRRRARNLEVQNIFKTAKALP